MPLATTRCPVEVTERAPNRRLKLMGRPQLKRDPLDGGDVAVMTRISSALLLTCLAMGAQASHGQVRHLEQTLGSIKGPVANSAIDARIAQAATQYRRYAPVPRIALYDMAYPRDCAELRAMNGRAVLVVTAIAQDSTELPPPRLYLQAATKSTDLVRVAGVESRTAPEEVKTVFGAFRVDVLYLLPVAPSLGEGDLLLDFAAHRQGFRLTSWSGRLTPALASCPATPISASAPADAALWGLVRREYPDPSGSLAPRH